MRRAVGYVRVSQVGGREGDSFLSPELQRKAVEEGAARYGYELTHIYEELDVSGRAGVKRPKFEHLFADARAGRLDAVIVAKLSRFGRSVPDGARHLRELDALGVALVALDLGVDTSTTQGKFLLHVMLALAEMESDRIGDEWRAVRDARKQRGLPHVTPTSRPYGYRVEGGRIVGVDEAEAGAVMLAFQLRAKGASYSEIQSRLRAEGYRPQKGGDKFARPSLRTMLCNPLYAGLVEHEGELIESDKFDAIVTRERWDAVQATHAKASTKNRYRSRVLSGTLRCSGCGSTLTVEQNGGVRYYACRARDHARDCPCKVSITADAVDAYVEQQLQLSRFTTTDDRGTGQRRQLEALEAERDKLREGFDRLEDDRYRLGKITADRYEHVARGLTSDVQRVEAEIAELRAEQDSSPDFLEDGRIVGWAELTLREQQRIVARLIEHIVIHPAAKRGGSAPRIDFAQRLRFVWRLEAVASEVINAVTESEPVVLRRDEFTGEQLSPSHRDLAAQLETELAELSEPVAADERQFISGSVAA